VGVEVEEAAAINCCQWQGHAGRPWAVQYSAGIVIVFVVERALRPTRFPIVSVYVLASPSYSLSLSLSLSLSVSLCVCVWVSVRAFQLSLRDKTKHGAEVKAKLCLSQNNAWPTRRLQLQKQHGLLCDSYTHTPTHKYTYLYKIYTQTYICNQ